MDEFSQCSEIPAGCQGSPRPPACSPATWGAGSSGTGPISRAIPTRTQHLHPMPPTAAPTHPLGLPTRTGQPQLPLPFHTLLSAPKLNPGRKPSPAQVHREREPQGRQSPALWGVTQVGTGTPQHCAPRGAAASSRTGSGRRHPRGSAEGRDGNAASAETSAWRGRVGRGHVQPHVLLCFLHGKKLFPLLSGKLLAIIRQAGGKDSYPSNNAI